MTDLTGTDTTGTDTTGTDTPPTKILGSLRVENDRGVVRVEDLYRTGIDDLWSAITDPGRLARWLVVVEGDLRVGGSFTARFTSGWEGTGRVDSCDAPHRLVVTTTDDSESGDEMVIEATLLEEGSGTRLVIEEHGLPLSEYTAHGAGWQAHIEDLSAHIDGRPASNWSQRWAELNPAWVQIAP